MVKFMILPLLGSSSMIGCAGRTDTTSVPANHPANPTAMESTMNHSSEKASAPAVQSANVSYTCPMHPEVTSDKPGRCPECGMNLVKKGS